jgi:hypothetical protein
LRFQAVKPAVAATNIVRIAQTGNSGIEDEGAGLEEVSILGVGDSAVWG